MKKYLLIAMLSILVPLKVNAALDVGYVKDYQSCLDFQASYGQANFNQGYFGHCVKATCYSGTWQTQFYTEGLVKCSNGNQDPLYFVAKSSCTAYSGACRSDAYPKYCAILASYDCSRTSNGLAYTTTTKKTTTTTTTTTTTKKTNRPNTTKPNATTSKTTTSTTTTTSTLKDSNSYLKELTLKGTDFIFSRDVETYNLKINKDLTTIEVTAKPESEKATVKIENNENIDIDKPILITVTAEDDTIRVYRIILSYADEKDNNTSLSKIEIQGYNIEFKPDVTEYTLKINKSDKTLDMIVETESDLSTYEIKNNTNLKNKSKVVITVTAENGDTKDYTITIKKSSNFGLILIILILLGICGYVIYKLVTKMPEQKEDDGYDYE
ncbi:MAG: cadherin-like beta sandwich domain-containing protein [Bacilli bacterium]